MKINVACGCGSTFQAPEHLAGQTVKCPACSNPLTIAPAPPVTPPAAAPEQGSDETEVFDVNDLSALDQTTISDATAHGSTVNQSAMRSIKRRGGSTAGHRIKKPSASKEAGVSKELDDRMKRMYEVYSGQEMNFGGGKGGKLKLFIGLGIAALTIGIGIAVAWHVLKTEYQPALDSARNMVAGGDRGENDPDPAIEDKGPRAQKSDLTATWQPGQPSGVALSGVSIQADHGEPQRVSFDVAITPENRSGNTLLGMSTAVTLYRSTNAQGPFTQADRVQVQDYDQGTGVLRFTVYDAELADVHSNTLHYRVSGEDSGGGRLFDTPAVTVAHADPPQVKLGRVSWTPKTDSGDAPALRVQARLDAPGWENVLLWQVLADGPIDQLIPTLPTGLPVVVESAVYSPRSIDLDSQGKGRWQMSWASTEISRKGRPGVAVVGVAPVAGEGGLDAQLTPDESAFTGVTRNWEPGNTSQRRGTIRFTPVSDGASQPQSLALTTPPVLEDIYTTPLDGRVLISWDNTALLAGLEHYDGQVAIDVLRLESNGSTTTLAHLPTETTHYLDDSVQNGQRVSYEVRLVQAGVNGADPAVKTQAWVQGHGPLPVLAAYPFNRETPVVLPEPGLDGLRVSLGLSELAYDNSGLAASRIVNAALAAMDEIDGLDVVDRSGLQGFFLVGGKLNQSQALQHAGGGPAQVKIRLVDRTTSEGEQVALWATDIASGQSKQIAIAPASQIDQHQDTFIGSLKAYLHARLNAMPGATGTTPSQTPARIIVGPIWPVDQLELYYGCDQLTDRLAEAADLAHDDLRIMTRKFWISDNRQSPEAIQRSLLTGCVIVTGRAWTDGDALPGVCLRAIDASTGLLIDRFQTDRMTPQAQREFTQWCATLKTHGTAPAGEGSLLVKAEHALPPIHPVWHRQAVSPDTTPRVTGNALFGNRREEVFDDRPAVSFGLAMPKALLGVRDIQVLDPENPIAPIRPYLAPHHPLSFDRWTDVYARYIEADNAAFLRGFEQISRHQQGEPGPFKPNLMVRGKQRFTGNASIPAAAGSFRVTPAALCLREFFPMGDGGQPMINYREDLSNHFKQRTWASYQAWKKVDRAIAEPFLKSELFGVHGGTYDRIAYPEKPAPLHNYAAAKLLARMNQSIAVSYEKKARAIAHAVLNEILEGKASGKAMTPELTRWSTDAMLVLAFERDPAVIEQLEDPDFRKRYFQVQPTDQADVLRMLVDQAGPRAWGWAEDFDSIDWAEFLWESPQEMDRVTQAMPGLIPQATLTELRAWLDADQPGAVYTSR